MNSKMRRVFMNWEARLQARISEYDSFGVHHGERGERRENAIAELLREILPHKYRITSGEIEAANGATSKQCDIIIYDNLHSPVLCNAQDTKIIPAESAYAVIEVKPKMDSMDELHVALDNIRIAKQLPRDAIIPSHGGHHGPKINPPLYGGIITYGKHLSPEIVLRETENYCAGWSKELWVDQVCFLGTAVIIHAQKTSTGYIIYSAAQSPGGKPTPKVWKQENTAFGFFVFEMLYHLCQMDIFPPDLQKYLFHSQTGDIK